MGMVLSVRVIMGWACERYCDSMLSCINFNVQSTKKSQIAFFLLRKSLDLVLVNLVISRRGTRKEQPTRKMPRDAVGRIHGACDQGVKVMGGLTAGTVGAKTKGASIPVDEKVEGVWKQILKDDAPVGWVVLKYSDDGKSINLHKQGDGVAMEAFTSCLKDDIGDAAAAWGAFRCNAVDERGSVTCKRPKFLFVQYMPDNLPGMRKAKMGSHKGTMKDILTGCHADMLVCDVVEDLDKTELVKKLQAATGAHKPNGYEFDDGTITPALGFTQT